MFDFEELLPLTAQIKKMYVSACREVCEKYGITQTEFDILEFLGKHYGPDTANEISKWKLIKKANVSTSVERLIEKGYLRRRPDRLDRRYIHLELTDEAACTVNDIKNTEKEFYDSLLSALTMDELELYKKLTRKLIHSMKLCGITPEEGKI